MYLDQTCIQSPQGRHAALAWPWHIALGFALLLVASMQSWAGHDDILVLHSYSQEYPWTQRQHQGFVAALAEAPVIQAHIHSEYLDTKRIPYGPEYAEFMAAYMARKYHDMRPRAIYVSDDNALAFALDHLDRIFPGVPVFFSGINDLGIKVRLDPARVTGVFERKETRPNLDLMRQLDPGADSLLVLGDNSETAGYIRAQVEADLGGIPGLRAEYLFDDRLDRLLEALRERPQRFILLTSLGNLRNADGENLVLAESLAALTKAGDFVMLSMEDAYVGPGVLGGYVTSGQRQGALAAGLVRRYLAGTPLSELAPIETGANQYLFDAPTLAEHGLELPEPVRAQATLLNAEPGFYAANRVLILFVVYTLAALLAATLAVSLYLVTRKNRVISRHSASLSDHARQLEQTEDSLVRAQYVASMGNWDWDIVSNGLYWSAGIYRLFGLAPDAFAASYDAFVERIHPDDRGLVQGAVAEALAGRADYSVRHRIVRPDGEVRVVQENGDVVRDAGGKPIRMIGTVRDVTEQAQAEQALAQSEAKFRGLIEHLHAGVVAHASDSRILFANRAACDMLGLSLEQMLGKAVIDPDWHFTREDGSLMPVEEYPVQRVLASREEVRNLIVGVNRPQSGDFSWVLANAYPEFDGRREIDHVVVTFVDITQRKRAEETIQRTNAELEARVAERTRALAAAKEQAEQANMAKSEFLSRMSHELRTPMNAILGFSQLLQQEALSPGQAESVEEILSAGRHLLELINEVLDLARIESGKLSISLEPVPLVPLVEECLALMRPQVDAHPALLRFSGTDCDVAVLADRTRLKQVLLNLISNAIKYNRRGGTVSLECVRGDGRMEIRVTDQGAGLSPDQQARLFTPFERLDADRQAIEGTGIGLALSKRLTELMQGEIGLHSAPGAGSTFWVRLGLAPAAPRPAGKAATGKAPVPGAGGKRWKVLCIEDNPANLRLIGRILALREDVQLIEAANPSLGLELAASHRPDLILLDINLPDMDGYEVLAHLRAETATRATPVIAVSANAMPRDVQRAREAGFDDYLTKPLDVAHFLAVIDQRLIG